MKTTIRRIRLLLAVSVLLPLVWLPTSASAAVGPTTLQGVVTDADVGTPISGVEMAVYPYEADGGITPVATAVTGADGRYSIDLSSEAPGSFRLDAVEPGGPHGGIYGYYVSVAGGLTTTADIAMPLGGTIAGMVTAPGGAPIEGSCASVVIGWEEQLIVPTPICTDATGAYETPTLPPSSYALDFSSPDRSTWLPVWGQGAQVTPGNTTILDVELRPAAPTAITGVVVDADTDQPLAGIDLTATTTDGNPAPQVLTGTTDVDGAFTIAVSGFPLGDEPFVLDVVDPSGTYLPSTGHRVWVQLGYEEVVQIGLRAASAGALADLAVQAIQLPWNPPVGRTITATIQYENYGPTLATDAVLDVAFPPGTTIGAVTAPAGLTCTPTGSDLQCTAASLAVDGDTINVEITPGRAGQYDVIAALTSATPDPIAWNDQLVRPTNVVVDAADLGVAIWSDGLAAATPGTINIEVVNDGPATARDAVVTALLPADWTIGAISSQFDCTVDSRVDANEITCTADELAVYSYRWITITVTAPTVQTDAPVDVTVTHAGVDPNPANDTANVLLEVLPEGSADLQVYAYVPSGLEVGIQQRVQLQISNQGPSAAQDVTAAFEVPAEIAIDAVTTTDGLTCSTSGTTVTCELAELARYGGTQATIDITPTTEGSGLPVTASVTSPNPDPRPENNTVTTDVTITTPGPTDIAVYLSVWNWNWVVGQSQDVQLNVYGNGDSGALDVVGSFTLPAGWTIESYDADERWTCTDDGATVTCTAPSMPRYESRWANITVVPTAPGNVDLTATVTTSSTDTNPSNDTWTDTVIVRPDGADLGVSLTTRRGEMAVDAEDRLTMFVTNYGPRPAADVVAVLTLPAELAIDRVEPSFGWDCTVDGQIVTCTVPELWSWSGANIDVYATPQTEATGITASGTVSSATEDGIPDNDTGTVTFDVLPSTPADLDVSVWVYDDPILEGNGSGARLNLNNLGSTAASEVVTTLELPAEVTIDDYWTSTGAPCTRTGQTITCDFGTMIGFSSDYVYVNFTGVTPGEGIEAVGSATTITAESDLTNNSWTTVFSVVPIGPPDLWIGFYGPNEIVEGIQDSIGVELQNNGTSPATDVVAQVVAPAGVTVVDAVGLNGATCVHDGQTVTCEIAEFFPGNYFGANISVVADAVATGLTFDATITSSSEEANPADNSASWTVDVVAYETDLWIWTSSSHPDFLVETAESFTATAYNYGPAPADTTVMEIVVPTELTITSIDEPSAGACTQAGQIITCDLGSLPRWNQQSVTVHVLPGATPGQATFEVAVTSTTPETAPSNNSGTSTFEIVEPGPADLSMSWYVTPTVVLNGEGYAFMYVTNVGRSAADDVVAVLELPADVAVTSIEPSGLPCTLDGVTITCQFGTLDRWEGAGIDVWFEPLALGARTVTMNATTSSTETSTDNNAVTADFVVAGATADVSVNVWVVDGPVTLGEESSFRLSASNAGPLPAADLEATMTLPDGLIIDRVEPFVDEWTCAVTGQTVTCSTPELVQHQSHSATVFATPTAVGQGLPLTGSVSTTTDDPNPDNDTDAETFDVVSDEADLRIDTYVSDTTMVIGEQDLIQFELWNFGPADALDVTATAQIPAEVTVDSFEFSSELQCELTGQTVTCTAASLEQFWYQYVWLYVTPIATATGVTASATISGARPDPNPDNDTDTVNFDLVPAEANLTIGVGGYLVATDPSQLSLGVSNWGPAVATDVVATVDIPAGWTIDTLPNECVPLPPSPTTTTIAPVPAPAGTCESGQTDVACTQTANTVSCTIAELGRYESRALAIGVTPDVASPAAAITGSVTSPVVESDPTDNALDTTVVVHPFEADLDAGVSLSDTYLVVGEADWVSAWVTNNGPAPAYDTVWSVTLPAELTATGVDNDRCTVDGQTLTCQIDRLDWGNADRVFVDVVPNAVATDLTVTTTAATTTPDPVPANDTATSQLFRVDPDSADLAVTSVSVSDDTMVVTESDRIFVTVQHAGVARARGVSFDVNVPAELTVDSYTTPSGWTCNLVGQVLTCDRGRWLPGGSSTVTIWVTPNNAGDPLTVTASISTSTTDPDPANSSLESAAFLAYPHEADLAVTSVTVSDTTMVVTEQDEVEMYIRHTGPAAVAGNTVATLTVPPELSIDGLASNPYGWVCTFTDQVATCDVGALPINQTEYARFDVTPNAPGDPLTVTGAATSDVVDPEPANSSLESAAFLADPHEADLAVTSVTVSDTTMVVTEQDYVEVQLRHTGPAAVATNTVATLTVPAELTIDGLRTNPYNWVCTFTDQVATCDVGDLPINQIEYARFDVTPNAPGDPLTVTGAATSDVVDPDPANSTLESAAFLAHPHDADLSVNLLTVSDSTMVVTETDSVTVRVRHDGHATTTSATLTIEAPPELEWGAVVSAPGDWACLASGTTMTCEIGSIAINTNEAATIFVTPTAAGTDLTVDASVTGPLVDPDPSDNALTSATFLAHPYEADVRVATLIRSDSTMVVSEQDRISVRLANDGPAAFATDVELSLQLPAELLVDAIIPPSGWTCTQTGQMIDCLVGSLPLGTSPYLYVDVTPDAVAAGADVTATVTTTITDPDPTDDTAVLGPFDVLPFESDLGISLSTSDTSMVVGEQDWYRFRVTNSGPAAQAAQVAATLTVPDGLAIDSITDPSGWTCTVDGQVVTCTIATLATGTSPYAYVYVTPTSPGTDLVAAAAVTTASVDPNSGNDTTDLTVAVAATESDLSTQVSVSDPTMVVGEPEWVRFRISNVGPAAFATDVAATLTLPAGLTLDSLVAPTGWSCTETALVVSCDIGAMPIGTSPYLYAYVTATTPAAGVTATAQVTTTSIDPTPANDTSTVEFDLLATENDVAVSITALDSTMVVGEQDSYRLAVSNGGPAATASGVALTVDVPAELTIDAVRPPAGWSCTTTGQQVACDVGALPLGTSPYLYVDVTPTAAGTDLVATATVTTTSNDPNPANNTATAIVSSRFPNNLPQLDVAFASTAGAAPFDAGLVVTATDADPGTLQATVDFGDGTRTTVPITTVPQAFPHDYLEPGTYLVHVSVTDGEATVTATGRVEVVLPEPLVAHAGDDRLAFVDQAVSFDAVGSRPSALISTYVWDFGDGTQATGRTATHVYTEPGVYEVVLETTSGIETDTDTAVVTVEPAPLVPGLQVTTTSGGALLAGADVAVILGDGTRLSARTDATGTTTLLGMPDGETTVYAWANGYLPSTATAQLASGSGQIEIELVSGDLGATTIESRRLTLDEIVDAGIDVDDPENNHVYEFEIWLNIDPFDPDGGVTRFYGYICQFDCGGTTTYLERPGEPPARCTFPCGFAIWGGSGSSGGGATGTVSARWIGDRPVLHYLVIPGEARFLKEFFEVKLITQNLSGEPFVFTDGEAVLELPAGLALAPTSEPQTLRQDVPDIAAGAAEEVTWIVRGDVEGFYDLTATYTAVLDPIDTPVRLEATTETPLRVWGGSALRMIVDADAQAYLQHPYNVRVGLENVSDIPVYNAAVELKTEGKQNYIYQPRERLTQTTAVIEPGTTFWTTYELIPTIAGNLDISDSFVRYTGGNVDLADEIRSHPPAQTPSTAPDVVTYGYETKIVFEWEPIPGATSYEVFQTADPDTDFGPNPVGRTDIAAAPDGSARAWAPVTQGADPWWAISPLVDGAPLMRHPLFRATPNQEYPKATISRDCTASEHLVTMRFEDPIFQLARYVVERDGVWFAEGPLSGNLDTATFTVGKAGLDLVGDTFTVTVINAERDESWTHRFSLRSVCVRYAVLGDSFSSGEGAFDYDWRTFDHEHVTAFGMSLGNLELAAGVDVTVIPEPKNECHRSSKAYGPELAKLFDETYLESPNPNDVLLFAACSSAVTDHVRTEGQFPDTYYDTPGADTQIAALADFAAGRNPYRGGIDVVEGYPGVDFVTLSIGGNDFGFSGIITTCLATSCATDAGMLDILTQVHDAYDDLTATLSEVRSTAGSAAVFAFGYPDLVSPEPATCGLIDLPLLPGLSQDERTFAQDILIPYINHIVSTAAADAGVNFVDVEKAFYDEQGVSHRICDPEPWANGIVTNGPAMQKFGVDLPIGMASFHPNAAGHQAFLRVFEEQYGAAAATAYNPLPDNPVPQTPHQFLGRPELSLAQVVVLTATGVEITTIGATGQRTLTITATGFQPGSTVYYELRSDPVPLGTAVADGTGTAVLEATIPPDVPVGFHSVLVDGTSPDGGQHVGVVSLSLTGAAPVGVADSATTTSGEPVVIDVLGNDTDVDTEPSDLRVSIVEPPSSGVAVLGTDGTVEFHPAHAFCGTTSFSYRVFDGQLYSDPATVDVTVLCAPEAPSAPVGTSGDSGVSLVWDAPADGGSPITDYVVEVSDDDGATWTTVLDGVTSSTSAEVDGLTNGTSYRFRVAAINEIGQGDHSDPSAPVVPLGLPGAPSTPDVQIGDGQVNLGWVASADDGGTPITDYVIEYSDNAGFSWSIVADGASSLTTASVVGLTNGTAYVFRVAAVNNLGQGEFSPASLPATPAAVPDAPSAPSATTNGGTVELTWVAPAANGGAITDYVIEYRAVGAGGWTVFADGVSTQSSAAVVGLPLGIAYEFRVAAANVEGTGTFSPVSDPVMPITVPDAPGVPSVTAGNAQVSLTWTAPSSDGGAAITNYVVQYKTTAAASWSTFADGASSTRSTTVTGLTNGTAYIFRVAAVNSVGQGALSAASTQATPSAPVVVTVPGAPGVPVATAGNGQVSLTWSAPASNGGAAITDYVVQYKTAASGTWSTFADGVSTTRSATVTGLTNGTAYVFRVAAVNAVGQGPSSAASIQATPTARPPDDPPPVDLPVAPPPLASVVPGRLLETRIGPGLGTVDGDYYGGGRAAAGSITEFVVTGRGGVDSDATAAMLNIIAIRPSGSGYLTVFPCGEDVPNASSVNYVAEQVVPNAVLAKIGAGGKVCIFTTHESHLVADVNGFVPEGGSPSPVVPGRLLETRRIPDGKTVDGDFLGGGRAPAGSITEFLVAGRGGVDADASAVILNVTAVRPALEGYLTVFPCGEDLPNASSVNYQAGQVVPNAVLAKIGEGGKVCIFTLAETDLIVDVNAFVPAGGSPNPVLPVRLLETRSGPNLSTVDGDYYGGGRVAAGSITEFVVADRGGVDPGASAVMLNIIAIRPSGPGYLTVFPCGEDLPNASSVNYRGGDVVPNAVLAKVGAGGKICIFTTHDTHLVADVNGFVPG